MFRLLQPPVFPNEEITRLARKVWIVLLTLVGLVAVLCFANWVLLPANAVRWLVTAGVFETGLGSLLWIVHRGFPRLAAKGLIALVWAILTVAGWTAGGIHSPATMCYLLLLPIAGLLLGRRGVYFTGTAGLAATGLFLVAEHLGVLPVPMVHHTAGSVWAVLVCLLVALLVVQQLDVASAESIRRELGARHAGQRTAEAALQVSKDRFAAVFDAVREGVFIHDAATGRILDVNRSCCELYGYDREGMLRLTPETGGTGVPPYSAAEVAQWFQRARTQGPQLFEWQARHQSGRLFWVELNLHFAQLRGQDCFVATARDITERKRALDALNQSESRLQLAIEGTSDGLFDLNLQTGEAYCSPRYFAILGYGPTELPSSLETWRDLVHPDDRSGALAAIQEYLDRKIERHEIQYRMRAKDGSWRWILSRGRLVARDPEGRPQRLIGTHLDITEKKQTEQALARERDLVARLVATSPAGITVVDRSGQIVFANEQAERVLGLHRSEITHRRYDAPEWQITDFDGRPVTEDELPFRRVVSSGQPVSDIHHAIAWPDGRRVMLSINAAPIFDSAGAFEAMVATVEDISARVSIETALRESEERMRSLTDHAPFGVHLYELEPGQRLVFRGANQSADRILRVDHRAFIGRTITEAFPGLADTEIPPAYLRVIATGQPYHAAQINYQDGGISGAFDVHAVPIGRHRLAVFFADITERQRAEAALRATEDRFRMLFNAGSDAVFVHGIRGDGSYENFSQVNDVACQFLGYSREELLQMEPADTDAPESLPRNPTIRSQLARNRRALFEVIVRTKDGRHIPVEINAQIFDLEGKPTVFSVMRDITERKKLEEQLRQSQKMEVFGQLAGGVAHDFNNLLIIISGNAELLLAESGLDRVAREQLEEMHNASRRAAALTRQLLLFSRKQRPQAAPIELNAIVTNHVKLLRRIIGEDINLTVEFSPSALPVLADGNMLEQVVMNLAVNARDAMPRGGQLTLATRLASLATPQAARAGCPPGDYAALVVRDTGEGIPLDRRSRIFEPFFTTKTAGKGTGLGLSIVLSIVQQHHGGIGLESAPGQGTEFTIYLPLLAASPGPAGAPTPAATPSAVRQSATVLVAEDDASVRKVIEHSLRTHGYRVVCADSGSAGLAALEADPASIHAVLSDVVMPGGLTGTQLAEEIGRRWPDLPVMLMSGYAQELQLTGTPILQKPFTIAQLLAAVQEGLSGRPSAGPAAAPASPSA